MNDDDDDGNYIDCLWQTKHWRHIISKDLINWNEFNLNALSPGKKTIVMIDQVIGPEMVYCIISIIIIIMKYYKYFGHLYINHHQNI